jgi:hypothetical protein
MATMKKLPVYLLTIISLSGIVSLNSFSQEKITITPSVTIQYVKVNDKASLQSRLTYSGEAGDLPLKGVEISFSTGSESKTLGTATTDENGTAAFNIEENTRLPVNAQGTWIFKSVFTGKDTIGAATATLSVKAVKLEMTLSLVDTVKTITIVAYSNDSGKRIPVKGENISVFVPRMFSNLPVGEVKLDENGTGKIEFPSDIPGDKDGNLEVVARFFEHPVYGTVESMATEKWGVPTSYTVPGIHRALWTKTPPMWMIITLSVLLTGVWGHYMFAVISLILIKIDAKRKKAKEEYKV